MNHTNASFYSASPLAHPLQRSSQAMSAEAAEQFLRDKFDWSTPKSEWQAAKVAPMLRHFGLDDGLPNCTVFGLQIRKLNGGMSKRSNGVNWTWLPPLKA